MNTQWMMMIVSCCVSGMCSTVLAQDRKATDEFDGPWRYQFEQPGEGWELPNFDDAEWQQGYGGFGTPFTPNSRVATRWDGNDIWLRRKIHIDRVPELPALLLHHDEDVEVFLNGAKIFSRSGYTTEYQVFKIPDSHQDAIQRGDNMLAVHCRQTTGGQFIDVHLIDGDNVPELPPVKRSTIPFKSQLVTKWGEAVTPENAWQQYPRPQFRRASWQNLNGHWDYAITAEESETPSHWAGKILVPFCLESKLSGVQRLLNPGEVLWYHRSFVAKNPDGSRLLLNFEAVDYECQVFVNGQFVGKHRGGNTPFTCDVTDAANEGNNDLIVQVIDGTSDYQLRGKQILDPHGIWYTRVSGIWQTVWLEQVPEVYLNDVVIRTGFANDDRSQGWIDVSPLIGGDTARELNVAMRVFEGDQLVAKVEGEANQIHRLPIDDVRPWSPDDPFLYRIELELDGDHDNAVNDVVETYAGIRTVGMERDQAGDLRFTLNGDVIFHWGPLDQGWWPDGLLTPPSEEAMVSDIEYLKAAGFNMIRKHIKVEPRRYYYDCDRLGMMVWQDQVSGMPGPPWTRLQPNPEDATWPEEAHRQFMYEWEETIGLLENHPAIVVWIPFNEAWGQHQTMEVGKWTMDRDQSRLVNVASGGNFWPIGHVVDQHAYPHPEFPFNPDRFADFIKVVGEFGGHGLPVEGHLWDAGASNWGYGGLPKNAEEYRDRYEESLRRLIKLKSQGIAGAVYTQTTDVEGEVNGLMTYDRKAIKIPAEELRGIHRQLIHE